MNGFEDTRLAATAGDVSERAIEREADVDLPVTEVWRLWTTEEGITEWSVAAANVELAVGGRYELFFDADGAPGTRGGEGNRVLGYLPPRMLSFTWNAPPLFPEERERRTWVVVELAPAGDTSTHVRLTHLGWPDSGWSDGSRWPEVFAYFERAWTNVLAALVEHGAERQGAPDGD
jgi:uncharacterized protein YndB with AHSA1/START domain